MIMRSQIAATALLLGLAGLAAAQNVTPPTVAQIAFAPASIPSGTTSRLTITLGNANAAPATLTAVLTDTLPIGMSVANPAALGGTCGAGATAAAGSVSLATGTAIPPGGCTVQINVTATSTTPNTYYTDSIAAGALQTTLGANPASASGTLAAQATAVVPRLVGLSQAAAAKALQAAGFALGAVTKGPGPGTVPYNAIFSQTPQAGTAAAAGSAVAVTISTGAGLATNPNEPLTSVPNFVTPYQQSEAAALERVCAALQSADPSSLTVAQRNLLSNCNAIIGTYGGGVNAAGLKQTLDAIGGKQTTAEQRIGVQFAGAQFTNLGARLAQLRQGVGGLSLSGLDLGLPVGSAPEQLLASIAPNARAATSAAASAPTGGGAATGGGASADNDSLSQSTRLSYFINGSVRRGTQDTTTYETPFAFRGNSLTAGVDYRFTNQLVAGVSLGHSSGSTNFTDGSGRLDSRSNSLSLYGTYYLQSFYVDVIASYGRVSYDSARTTQFSINPNIIDLPPNCGGTECAVNTTGSTTGRQLATSVDLGYSFNEGGLTWGPDVALNYSHLRVNSFSEIDAEQSGLALVFGEDTGESLLAKTGGHIAYAIKTAWCVILPEARAHYVHEFKNDQRSLSVHFRADPDAGTPGGPVSNFLVFTDPPDRGYYDWAAGVSAQFPYGISAFIDYNAIASHDQRVHELALGLRIEHPFH
jgi:uncharacterized protein YhjY with autotransporter beta-barrel domain